MEVFLEIVPVFNKVITHGRDLDQFGFCSAHGLDGGVQPGVDSFQLLDVLARFIADSMRSMYLNWFGQACATGTPLAQMGAPLYALCGEIMSSLEDDTTINPTAAGSVEDAEREALFE